MRAEFPVEFEEWSTFRLYRRSDSEMEALMGTLPFTDPEPTTTAVQLLREALVDCLEEMEPQDRFVLEALWFEQITVRALAERMGLHKSRTHRIAQRAVLRLGERCACHPLLASRYVA